MTKRDKIRILLNNLRVIAGNEKVLNDLLTSLPIDATALAKIKPKLSEKFAELIENIVEKQIDLYDKMLSEDAISASIDFYASPAGAEVIEKLPKLHEELATLSMLFAGDLLSVLFEIMGEANLSEDIFPSLGIMIRLHKEATMEGDTAPEEIKPEVKVEDEDKNLDDNLDNFLKEYIE